MASVAQVRSQTWDLVDLRARTLFASLVALNAVDVVTTRVGLDRGAVEQNPVMAGAVGTLAGAVAAKLILMTMATAILLVAARRGRSVNGVLWFAVVWYIAIITWNVRVIMFQT